MRRTRDAQPTRKGLLQPSGFWLLMVAGLLLTVTSSDGQDSRIRLTGKLEGQGIGDKPETTQSISHDDLVLGIANAALDGELNLVIQPLASKQLAGLDGGMSNVTKGPRSGYRMLPHGTKFKQEIRITLPYDKA